MTDPNGIVIQLVEWVALTTPDSPTDQVPRRARDHRLARECHRLTQRKAPRSPLGRVVPGSARRPRTLLPDHLAATFVAPRRAMDHIPVGATDCGTAVRHVDRVRASVAAIGQRGPECTLSWPSTRRTT